MDEQKSEGAAANVAAYGDPNPPFQPIVEGSPAKAFEPLPEDEDTAETREARCEALVASMEHQIKHNGPITLAMIRELRDLLGVHDEPNDSETE